MDKIEVTTEFFDKCHDTYSADVIAYGEERVRGVIEYRGKSYVCTGGGFGPSGNYCELSEVREARFFDGKPHHYNDHNWDAERNYHGIRFKRNDALWVFLRNKIQIKMNPALNAPNGNQGSLLDFAA